MIANQPKHNNLASIKPARPCEARKPSKIPNAKNLGRLPPSTPPTPPTDANTPKPSPHSSIHLQKSIPCSRGWRLFNFPSVTTISGKWAAAWSDSSEGRTAVRRNFRQGVKRGLWGSVNRSEQWFGAPFVRVSRIWIFFTFISKHFLWIIDKRKNI